MSQPKSFQSPDLPTPVVILNKTKPKHVHMTGDTTLDVIGTQENLGELLTLETWGFIDFLEGGGLIPLTSDRRSYVLGRSPLVDIPLEDVEFLAPEHIKIKLRVKNPTWSGDLKVTIEDLNTQNGTLKNNEPLLDGPQVLEHQDVIQLVSMDYSFEKDCKPLCFQFLKAGCRSIHQHYQLYDSIGSGPASDVRKARSQATGLIVAIKIVMKPPNCDFDESSYQNREIALMKRLSHPFITKLVDIVESRLCIGLVIPIAPSGDLASFSKGRKLSTKELVQVYYQALKGLKFLHYNKLVHRDIKPQNILVFSNNPPIIKIADFGLMKKFNPYHPPTTRVGTPYYISPEVYNSTGHIGYSCLCDIYSVGVMFFQSVKRKMPFAKGEYKSDIKDVASFTRNSKSFSYKEKKLLNGLLKYNPNERLTAEEALVLPFFTDNYEYLYEQTKYEKSYMAKSGSFLYSQANSS